MTEAIKIRQTDTDYAWAERERRRNEAESARATSSAQYRVYADAQKANYEFRQLANRLGLNVWVGELRVMEQHLWKVRVDAWREYQYLLSITELRENLAGQAGKRYWDLLDGLL